MVLHSLPDGLLAPILTFVSGIFVSLIAARVTLKTKREDFTATSQKTLIEGWQNFTKELRDELKKTEEECANKLRELREECLERDKKCNARITELERILIQERGTRV